jgi:hypothetical protein
MLAKKIELLRSILAQAQSGAINLHEGEEGQGVYIGGGALLIIIVIILLIDLT